MDIRTVYGVKMGGCDSGKPVRLIQKESSEELLEELLAALARGLLFGVLLWWTMSTNIHSISFRVCQIIRSATSKLIVESTNGVFSDNRIIYSLHRTLLYM